MNGETRRRNPRHRYLGARCAYAGLWNSLPTPGNSMQTVRNSGDRRGSFWRESVAKLFCALKRRTLF